MESNYEGEREGDEMPLRTPLARLSDKLDEVKERREQEGDEDDGEAGDDESEEGEPS